MRKTIVCFGDSNTWGYDAQHDCRFPEDIRWTGILQNLLGQKFKIIEEGLSGRTSVMDDPLFEGLNGLTYIGPCLRSNSPVGAVVIMLGTNDTKERFALTSWNIAQGITRIAKKAKLTMAESGKEEPKVLVISPPVIGSSYRHTAIGEAMGERCAEKSAQLAEYLEPMLKQEGIDFLDAAEIPMNEIDYMHLDEEGHKLLGQLVFNKLKDIL